MSKAVIFGPAEAGKSTLGGCLLDKTIPVEEAKVMRSEFVKKYGPSSLPEHYYSCLLDTGYGEGPVREKHGIGTTRTLKIKSLEIKNSLIALLDTPGFQHSYRQRMRGMAYASIGIFVVPISNILSIKEAPQNRKLYLYNQYFGTLLDWLKNTETSNNLIVVLSKFDQVDPPFSQDKYKEAYQFVADEVVCDDKISIIPTSVINSEHKSANIWDDDERNTFMAWYQGVSLSEELVRISDSIPRQEINPVIGAQFFAQCNEFYRKDYLGPIVAGMVNSGTIQKDANAKLYIGDGYENVKIRSVHKRGIQQYNFEMDANDFVVAGDLFSANIDLSKKTCDAILRSKRVPPMCITSEDQKCANGRIARFRLFEDGCSTNLFQSIQILWFDKVVSGRIISKYTTDYVENRTCIIVELYKSVSIPCTQDAKPLHSDFYIFDDYKESPTAFCSKTVIDVEDVRQMIQRQKKVELEKLGHCGLIDCKFGFSKEISNDEAAKRAKMLLQCEEINKGFSYSLQVEEANHFQVALSLKENRRYSYSKALQKLQRFLRKQKATEIDWKIHIDPSIL